MTLTINDTTMTSDQTAQTARHAPERSGWEVSWLPGQILDRNTAITAMILADTTAEQDLHEGHRLWPFIQGWAEEARPDRTRCDRQGIPTARRHEPPAGASQPAARPRGSRLNSTTQHRDQPSSPASPSGSVPPSPEKHRMTDV